MRSDEFELFSAELKQLCVSLGKSFSDVLVQAYWRALQDISLDELQANVERILLNANKETRFPRPAELRTSAVPRAPRALDSDPTLKDALARNLDNWNKALATNTPLAKWHLLSAYLARIDVEEEPASIFRAQRMAEAQGFAKRLLAEYGERWCTYDNHCMHAASRLLGGQYIAIKRSA